jgi:hypothetical protein
MHHERISSHCFSACWVVPILIWHAPNTIGMYSVCLVTLQ